MKKIKMMTLSLAVGTAFTFTAPAFGGTAYAAPVLDASISADDLADQVTGIAKDLAEEGIDYVAGLVPCGTWLAKPFKFVLGKLLDDGGENKTKSLLDEINNKMTEMKEQIGKVSAQISDLSTKLDEKTGIIATRIKNGFNLAALRDDIKALNYDINEVYKDVEDIAERLAKGTITEEQAKLELASLYKATRMDDLKFRIFNLRNSMSQNGGLIYADFYRTVFNCYAEDYMFSGEFFDKAKADADALTSQYLLGCGLLMTCQAAVPDVAAFSADQLAALDTEHFAYYTDIMKKQNRLEKDMKDTVSAVNAATEGYRKFYEDFHENRYVNYGLENLKFRSEETNFKFTKQLRYDHDFPGSYPGRYASIDEVKKVYKACQYHLDNLYFTPELMKKVTDYIRKNYPGMTIRQFYKEITGEDLKGQYVITDSKVEEKETAHQYGDWGGLGRKFDIHMKGIGVDDPKLEVKGVVFCKIGTGWFAGRNAYSESDRRAFYNGEYRICNFAAETDTIFRYSLPAADIFDIVYSGAKTYTNADGVLIQGPRFPIPGLTDF